MQNDKLWGGRFTKKTDSAAQSFHSSISFDSKLYKQDIDGSAAHARMLCKCGIISEEDSKKIIDGLHSILADIEQGVIVFSEAAEDIHMNIETALTERIGEPGKKLHTARSRNDQVALDTRMYCKLCVLELQGKLKLLMQAILDISSQNVETYMPGYTHLQAAQPITLAHHLMAYFNMFHRDHMRFSDTFLRTDVMPLGSGALAASPFSLDRHHVAEELDFGSISQNSMDAVSDRDFCIEFCSSCAITMMHLSRFCEEIILWSSSEFGYITLDDSHSTGSSIMPQKKNPDMAELIRGKTGRVYGSLISLLTMMKGLPLAYNKDMQEDKEQLFDAHETLSACLDIFTSMLKTAEFNKETMRDAALRGYTNATDVADYLVMKKGLPFRTAHEVSGKLVLRCIEKGVQLSELGMDEYITVNGGFGPDIYDFISLENCVSRRKIPGGPAPETVKTAIRDSQKILDEL